MAAGEERGMTKLETAAEALIDSVATDNTVHGGLVSRQTIRLSDELRILLSRIRARRKAHAGQRSSSPKKTHEEGSDGQAIGE